MHTVAGLEIGDWRIINNGVLEVKILLSKDPSL